MLRRTNKYNSSRASYMGKVYHSQQERNDAIILHAMVKSKKIKELKEQHRIDIRVNDIHICNHFVDFFVTLNDGRQKYVETKGFYTAEWKLKQKLIKATDPIPYLVNPNEKEILS